MNQWPTIFVATKLLCPWDFLGKNTGVSWLPFPAPGDLSSWGIELLHCRWILYYQGATREAQAHVKTCNLALFIFFFLSYLSSVLDPHRFDKSTDSFLDFCIWPQCLTFAWHVRCLTNIYEINKCYYFLSINWLISSYLIGWEKKYGEIKNWAKIKAK